MGKKMTPEARKRIAEQEAQALESLRVKVKKTAERVTFAQTQHEAAKAAYAAAKGKK